MQKNAKKYECKICDFIAVNKYNYKKHLETKKHKKQEILTEYLPKPIESEVEEKGFVCDCGKVYKHKQSLFNHKKKCKHINIEEIKTENIEETDKEIKIENGMVTLSIKDLKELVGTTNNTTNNITNNNQKFNLNLFLNETCKDALSIQDFLKSLQLSLKHLEYSKENGADAGVLNILREGLLELDVDKRPIHCTDVKRETLYIKDTDNGWEKNDNNNKMKAVITDTQNKQSKLINKWQEANPDWLDNIDKMDEYHKFINVACKNIDDKKVISDIAKTTEINKN
tara:strand:+ start:44 stop:895 length:852 start_codon:yes stop_codon:yes gene_type:complete